MDAPKNTCEFWLQYMEMWSKHPRTLASFDQLVHLQHQIALMILGWCCVQHQRSGGPWALPHERTMFRETNQAKTVEVNPRRAERLVTSLAGAFGV